MNAGLYVDEKAVDELRVTLDDILKQVADTLANNKVITSFLEAEYPKALAAYSEDVLKSIRPMEFYLKEYDEKNIVHRTYVVNHRLRSIGIPEDCKEKWTVSDLKKANTFYKDAYLDSVINKTVENTSEAMEQLAKDKAAIWNKIRTDKVAEATPESLVPPFNPGSSLQLKKLFSYLGVEPLAFSKDTGEPSWGRAQIEEVFHTTEDEDWKEFLQAFIDYSFGSIVRTNFIEAFDRYTVDEVMRGNLKLLGAKSARPTSNAPNLLNAPSTGSIYAKPLKKCFVAPDGYLVASADFGQLEDRVIANLTRDYGKCNIFLKDLDSHCYNALGYSKEDIAKHIDLTGDMVIDTKSFKSAIYDGNKSLKSIRQDSKAKTFKLSYGGFPDADKGGAITQEVFDKYHNELYPGITKTREEVLAQAKVDGYIHLGLGWRIYSDDIGKDSRTLWNACSQFWSILTLIAINEIHYRIDKAGYSDDIVVNATIYDSIYFIVKKDPVLVKWLNDNLIPIMVKDFMKDQTIKNTAELCIGTTWANVEDIELRHEESLENITKIVNSF